MIGIFDSGLGGLTVVKELWRALPDASILYLGDLARLPYGTKSAEMIQKYAEENTRFLLDHGAKAIVIACNTASSLAYDYLCSQFKDIPIFEVVTGAAEKALQVSQSGRIGVIGTRATIASGIYERKISELSSDNGAKIRVFSQAAPLLIPLIEEGWTNRPEIKTILRAYLQLLRNAHIDTLILACTHFPLIKDLIQAKIGRRVTIINSAQSIVQAIASYRLPVTSYQKESQFFVTDLTPHWQATAEKWLGRKIHLELAKV